LPKNGKLLERPVADLATRATALFSMCRKPLRKWFRRTARDLPWRRLPEAAEGKPGKWSVRFRKAPRRSPYAVWISEIMLQQTQVAAAIPYFNRWMERFPTVEALAAASEDEVLRAWAGLGYYARARNLHRGARALNAMPDRPVTAEDWESLPGVGPYTAGAVASLAFGQREPILDGNIIRVFSRLFGLNFLPGKGIAEKRAYWELARIWADAENPGEWNEALMELGALVCIPATPRCADCPLSTGCFAFQNDRVRELPPVKPRARIGSVDAVAVRVVARNKVLFEVRRPGEILAGHESFPLFLGADATQWRVVFQKRFPDLKIVAEKSVGNFQHGILSNRYQVEVIDVTVAVPAASASTSVSQSGSQGGSKSGSKSGSQKDDKGMRWVPRADLALRFTNALSKKIGAAGR
jgi:A/G-specific adenine glycosylase